jgi:FKBP-type peptidyl-prolyl cis-trans isomerase
MSVTAVPIRPTSRRVLGMLWGGLGVAVLGAAALAWAGTGRAVAETGTPAQFMAYNAHQPGVVETASGLQYRVLKEGEGDGRPTDADVVLVKYKGTLRDGTVFDQNERAPMEVAQVIPGFSEGLKLMRRGGEYRFWIKPELGYGDRATGGVIPPNSVLVFDVKLIDFIPADVLRQMQQQQQGMGGGAAPGAMPGR